MTATIKDGKHAGKEVRVIQRTRLLGVAFVVVFGKNVPLLTIAESRLK
jgi:hypothetical protein